MIGVIGTISLFCLIKSSLPTQREYTRGSERLDHSRPAVRCSRCSIVVSIFVSVVCWGAGTKTKDANRLNKLNREAESAVGSKAEDRKLTKLKAIMSNASHPLHNAADDLKNKFRNRYWQTGLLKGAIRLTYTPYLTGQNITISPYILCT